MSQEIKFTDEELTDLKNLQDAVNSVVLRFGQLNIEEISLTNASAKLADARTKLTDTYNDLLKKEKELAERLNARYGAGVLDPKTGIFTPSQQAPKNA